MRSVSKRVRHIRIVMIGKCPVAVVLSIFLRVDNKFGNGQTLPQGSQADKRTKTQQQEQVKGYSADDMDNFGKTFTHELPQERRWLIGETVALSSEAWSHWDFLTVTCPIHYMRNYRDRIGSNTFGAALCYGIYPIGTGLI
ncbi:uncharacterized protein LOC110118148 [Ceratitis capitata]|uniref:uncharacterized protein LOC110118148 n=1 Tax=Ceratitis capitata TaxID=7213 RepID=UPI000A10F20B|nr:uncharacterized protein LOC110118148 [Ceratitis capitata]